MALFIRSFFEDLQLYHEFHLCILNETSSLEQKRSSINDDDNDHGDDVVVDDDYDDDELNYDSFLS